jgi:vacuolar-type H+-ATPase subunit F/Vma7
MTHDKLTQGNVAVLGDTDFVMSFSALGLSTFPAATHADITEAAEKILDTGYTLVIVAEDVAPMAQEVFASIATQPTPCIVVVPFTTESKGFATEALAKVLKLATGINILQNP